MIYLDSAATTKPCREAVDAAMKTADIFANPSSLHRFGLEAQKEIENSRKIIADKLGVNSSDIFFTSGGTEANNTAVLGAAKMLNRRGKRVITTKIEHPSVLESFRRLEDEGFEVIYLNADANGIIMLDEFEASLTEDTILVSIMHVNNETGAVMPVEKLKPIMKKHSPNALLHCDCVQSFGKTDVQPKKYGIDMVSISAHKIHGFKGCGALYTANTRITPLILGGGQQGGLRPGTENISGICSFGAAAKAYCYDYEYVNSLRTRLKDGLINTVPDIKINGDFINSGNVLNVSFIGIKAEILLHSLEKYEIYVSTGSACSTHKPQPSHVLAAMGLFANEIDGAVRFSLDVDITNEDIDKTISAVAAEVEKIRHYMR